MSYLSLFTIVWITKVMQKMKDSLCDLINKTHAYMLYLQDCLTA